MSVCLRRARLLAAAVLALAALGACGDRQGGQEAGATLATPSPATAPAPAGVEGGVLRRLWSDPPTLDPHQASDTTSAGVMVEVYSGLVSISTDMRLTPDLAEAWSVGGGGTSFTFTLRPNARFQDGRPVTAEDVKYSMERALSPRTLSPTVDTYLDDILGVRGFMAGASREVSGLKVLDPRTLEVTIDAPKAYFLAKLTYPTAFVVDREQVEAGGTAWTRRPNATGPFRLVEYRVGERLVLESNPLFYLEPARLGRVEFILRGGSGMAMYENGEIEVTGVGLADLDRVTNPRDPLNRELVVAPPSFEISYIGLNVERPPFDDPLFRRSLALAIDRPLIADRVLSNLVVPATGILPPGFPGYTEGEKGLGYNPERAKELLAASRYATSVPRIVITVPGTGGGAGLDMEVIQDAWKQTLGVQTEIQQVEWATFLEDMNRRRLQAFAGVGWQADYPDPHDFLDILFHSRSKLNHTGYSNPLVDRLLEEARVAPTWEERQERYTRAERAILEDAPWVPLWFSGERLVLVKPYVKGYQVTPMVVPKLREVWIER